MIPYHGALAGLGLAEGDSGGLREGAELGMGFAVTDTTAADQNGLFGAADHRGGLRNGLPLRLPAGKPPHPFGEEAFGIVVGLALHVLGHGDAHRAGVGGVGEHPHGADHGAHQLLGTDDPVPVAAHRPERVVGGQAQIMGLLHLLQHGIRLAAGVDIAGQDQHRDVVGGSGGGGGDHIGGAGAHGRGDSYDFLALALSGEGHSGVGHALLILALPDLQPAGLLRQCLSQAYHVAVAGQHDHALNKGMFQAVIGDILILQKANQRLCHCQSNGFHESAPFLSPDRFFRWHPVSRAIRVLRRQFWSFSRGLHPDGGCPRRSTWHSPARRPGSGSRC